MLTVVDLLNRYCNGRRCREAAAELIMLLASLCLHARRLCVVCGYKKEMSPQEIFFFISLFNRYCSSLCCRETATELVMILVLFVCAKDYCVYEKHLYCLRYSLRKTIVFMTSIYKYLRYFESILQLQRYLRGFVLEWQVKVYYLR